MCVYMCVGVEFADLLHYYLRCLLNFVYKNTRILILMNHTTINKTQEDTGGRNWNIEKQLTIWETNDAEDIAHARTTGIN